MWRDTCNLGGRKANGTGGVKRMILGARAAIGGLTTLCLMTLLLTSTLGAVRAEDAAQQESQAEAQFDAGAAPSEGAPDAAAATTAPVAGQDATQDAAQGTVQDVATKPDPAPTFEQKVAQDLPSLLSSAPSLTKRLTSSEREALETFYGAPGRAAVWVSSAGRTAKAQGLVAELRKAGDYALRAADYKVPAEDPQKQTPEALAKIELALSAAALTYARHAKGGRTSPDQVGAQLTYTPETMEPSQVLAELASNADAAAYLRSLHPRSSQFRLLRKKLMQLRHGQAAGGGPRIPDGPVLKAGVSHAQVALLRKRLDVSGGEGAADRFDAGVDEAVKAFQRENGLVADGIVGASTRRVLNGSSPDKLMAKIINNMERWRWLPDDLGGAAGIYVWVNIPELRVRAIANGRIVFSEKAIVGQVTHQTPVFSDAVEWIEIHPTWFVPDSVKVDDILPSLRRPTSTVMERYDLKMNCGRHGSDPKKIDWTKVDIRKCSFSQPPGKSSVLGDFKFKFPNRHSVYLHDTHDHSLFKNSGRTYSHGCVRVENPRRLTKVLLGHDKGMTPEAVDAIVDGPERLHKEALKRPVPIHITYFTMLFGFKDGYKIAPDYYGHDARLTAVLSGKSQTVAEASARPAKAASKQTAPEEQPVNVLDQLF
jgi:L,D-transpeptidase YcbB